MDYLNQSQNNNRTSNFIISPSKIYQQLAKGYALIKDIIKASTSLNDNIFKLEEQAKTEKYSQVISGLLFGIIYDSHNSNYYQYLYAVTTDNYEIFFNSLILLIESLHMEFTSEIFLQIYDIFDKLVLMNNSKMIDIMILLCRCIYPGISIIEKPKDFLSFLQLIKNKLNWIIENSSSINLCGLIFIKIIRLLSETHIYSLNNNPDVAQRELFKQITSDQILIISKLWNSKQDDILKIGKELIRILIPLGKSDIEIISIIFEGINKKTKEGVSLYYSLLSTPHPIQGYNNYVQINIPPMMEKMLIFIMINIKRSKGYYQRYMTWIYKKFKIETAVGQTILIDISRYIVTCFFFYNHNNRIVDATPRWVLLGSILNITKNELLSGEIKQALFFDWLYFREEKDDINLIEPGIQIIYQSVKDYTELTMELIEYLDFYSDYFDINQKATTRHCVSEAFKTAEKFEIIPSVNVLLDEDKIAPEIKKKYEGLIKSSLSNNNNNSNNNTSSSSLRLGISMAQDNNYSTSSRNDSIMTNNSNNNQQIQSRMINTVQRDLRKELQGDNDSNNVRNNANVNPIFKIIEANILLSPEVSNLIQPITLKNFMHMKSTQTFHSLLDDLCKGYLSTFSKKNQLETNLGTLTPGYNILVTEFSSFYLNAFKDELLLIAVDDQRTKVSSYFFEYLLNKFNNVEFVLLGDIMKNLIDKHHPIIVNFFYYLSLENTKCSNPKLFYSLLTKIYKYTNKILKEAMILFFKECVDDFNSSILNFVIENGFNIFSSLFIDDDELLFNLIIYSNIQTINAICLQFVYDQFILFDKNFYKIISLAFDLTQNEQNKLWMLITSQGKIPSTNLKEFLGKIVEISHAMVIKGGSYHSSFFKHIIWAIKTIFKGEINEKNFNEFYFIFEFNATYAKYIFGIIITMLGICTNGRNSSVLFFNIVDEFFKLNYEDNGKMNNFRIMIDEIIKLNKISSNTSVSNSTTTTTIAPCSLLFNNNNTIQKLIAKFKGKIDG